VYVDGRSGKPTVATLYLNLVQKHLPNFYKFVHSVHKQNNGLFHDLLEWIESVITFMRTGHARTKVDYKTRQEIRTTVDLVEFVRTHIEELQWEELQREAEALQEYFVMVKERKREDVVRRMAGLDHSSAATDSSIRDTQDRGREKVTMELGGVGLQQEDVDELESVGYQHQDDEGIRGDEQGGDHHHQRGALKPPKVPVIDTLREPFVKLMNKALFRSARE